MSVGRAVQGWYGQVLEGWNRFWFTPADPQTLGMIRVLAGGMILYTHLVWSIDLLGFVGQDSWVNRATAAMMHQGQWTWSHLWWIQSPAMLWTVHILALVVFAMFTLGLFTRITSILTWLLVISYCHRMQGALYGLDQANAMLAMYLMVGACGDAFSLDRWRAKRQGRAGEYQAKVSTNIATRLIQLHLCVIYLFGGIGKMRGELWWDGFAMWYAAAALEYQSMDLTWIIKYPALMALVTHVTVIGETFYCFLVWPRLTRPIMVALIMGMHLGIAMFMGMITFGVAMMIANLAFVSPSAIRWLQERFGAQRTQQDLATA